MVCSVTLTDQHAVHIWGMRELFLTSPIMPLHVVLRLSVNDILLETV